MFWFSFLLKLLVIALGFQPQLRRYSGAIVLKIFGLTKLKKRRFQLFTVISVFLELIKNT